MIRDGVRTITLEGEALTQDAIAAELVVLAVMALAWTPYFADLLAS